MRILSISGSMARFENAKLLSLAAKNYFSVLDYCCSIG